MLGLAAVKLPDGRCFVMAEDLVEAVMQELGFASYEKVGSLPGSRWEGLRCRHPLYERDSVIVLGDHVSQHKPHPEPYQRAIGYLNERGVGDAPAATIVFEDSDSGVTSARAAGLNVRRVGSPKELLPAILEALGQPAPAV